MQPPPTDCEARLYQREASDLRGYALGSGAADLVFYTYALGEDSRMKALLSAMASATQGAFVQQPANSVNLFATDINATSSLLVERDLVVYNPNTVLRGGVAVPDSDGDGLSDEEEKMLGSDPARQDTDGDGVGDGIEHLLAAPGLDFDPLVAHTPVECASIKPLDRDSDADGLTDCEEAVLRTDPSLVDTDRDGLPDQLEVRRGGNPLVDDRLDDSDGDGIPNGEEVKSGLDALVSDAESELEYGYRYRVIDEGPKRNLEAVPHDPLPGVVVLSIDGATPAVGLLRYEPTPARLSWSDDARGVPPGPPVDVSKGGDFALLTTGGRQLKVRVVAPALPPASEGKKDAQLLIRPTLRDCIHFEVKNITLTEGRGMTGGAGRGWNNLQVYLAELPKNAPGGYLIYDLATVPVRFIAPDTKTPNKASITLDQDSFLLLEGTQ